MLFPVYLWNLIAISELKLLQSKSYSYSFIYFSQSKTESVIVVLWDYDSHSDVGLEWSGASLSSDPRWCFVC